MYVYIRDRRAYACVLNVVRCAMQFCNRSCKDRGDRMRRSHVSYGKAAERRARMHALAASADVFLYIIPRLPRLCMLIMRHSLHHRVLQQVLQESRRSHAPFVSYGRKGGSETGQNARVGGVRRRISIYISATVARIHAYGTTFVTSWSSATGHVRIAAIACAVRKLQTERPPRDGPYCSR